MSSRYNFSQLNVLVVDDNEHMRRLLRSILTALGFENIKELGDAVSAFEALQNATVDLAIVDWHMRPVDGLEFIRMVRRAPDSPNPYLPIIMLTGHTALRRVIEARDEGCQRSDGQADFGPRALRPNHLDDRGATVVRANRLVLRAGPPPPRRRSAAGCERAFG